MATASETVNAESNFFFADGMADSQLRGR